MDSYPRSDTVFVGQRAIHGLAAHAALFFICLLYFPGANLFTENFTKNLPCRGLSVKSPRC